VTGIDDPQILAPDAPNYWQAAWMARSFVETAAGKAIPRDDVGLAINSAYGRSQYQLHIHVDCIRPDVKQALHANLDKVGSTWTPFPFALAGHSYRSIRIEQDTLDGIDPFRLLADTDPAAKAEMGMHTLMVIGATFPGDRNGFVLLDDHADLPAGDRASGETLQDHTCAVGVLRITGVGERVDRGCIHVHRRVGQSDNYWSFSVIRRLGHSHSILRRNSKRSPEHPLTGSRTRKP